MTDLAIRGEFGLISSREWLPATSPSSVDRDRRLSSVDVRQAATYAGSRRAERSVRSWIKAVNDQLNTLVALEENWDTYGSPPPTSKAVIHTQAVLRAVYAMDVPVPRVRGTSDGGVTIEWYHPSVELILEIDPTGTVTSFVRYRATGETSEGSLSDEVDNVASALAFLRVGL